MKIIPKSFIRDYSLTALVFILLGVLFLVCPETSGKIICYIFGGFLCIVGIFRIVEYFKTPISLHQYSLGLVVGIIAIGSGMYVIAQPEFIEKVLSTILGLAVLLDSLIKLQNAVDMGRIHDKSWRYTLIMSLITAALGTILLIDPFNSKDTLVLFLGISMMINGIIDAATLIVIFFRIKKNNKDKKPISA